MAEQNDKGQAHSETGCNCPLCALIGAFKSCVDRNSDVFDHLKNAEAEVLKAVRSMIDKRLQETQDEPEKQATKIKVS